jgi:hypothetical protein
MKWFALPVAIEAFLDLLDLDRIVGQDPVVVTDENLHSAFLFDRAIDGTDGQGARATGARICIIRMSTAPDVRSEVD